MKATSIAEQVRKQVRQMRKAQPFAVERFRPLGPGNQNAVRPAIARMVSLGELERVYRGVFIRPKLSHYVGSVCTTVTEVAKILAKKHGHTLQIHGAEATCLRTATSGR
ncbi:hypothetical protein D3C84_142190 [compost metagenome]